MKRFLLLAFAFALTVSAAPAFAWHISGKVYCDKDNDGEIDGGDTPLSGITVKMTSQSNPANMFTDGTNASGEYFESLPDHPDTYKVELINLPPGLTVVVPGDGSHLVALTNSNNSRDNKNFLVQGCSHPTTTTTTITTTTSSTTTTLIGHFQCYEVKPATFMNEAVTVTDEFGSTVITLRYPHRLCAPADKNDEGMVEPEQHLVGYEHRGGSFTKQSGLLVRNQFGDLTIDVTRPSVFLVPSAKSLIATPAPLAPPTIDHFQCYKIKRTPGTAKFVPLSGITVGDQLEDVTVAVLKPVRLCAPADKNGEDPTAPGHPGHLLCYKVRSPAPFGTIPAFIANQFGTDDLTLIHRRELCVPSLLNP